MEMSQRVHGVERACIRERLVDPASTNCFI